MNSTQITEVLNKIFALAYLEIEDDLGLIRPTFYAYNLCLNTLLPLFFKFGNIIPEPNSIDTDRNADIRIVWDNINAYGIELVFPSDKEQIPFLYVSSKSGFEISHDISTLNILKFIDPECTP